MMERDEHSWIEALACGICQHPVGVEIGHGSYYDPRKRLIRIDHAAVDNGDKDYTAGLVAHECGHYLISRYNRWRSPLDTRETWNTLCNSHEDARVDAFILRRHPGSAPWFRALATEVHFVSREAVCSAFVAYTLATAAEARLGWSMPPLPWLAPGTPAADAFAASAASRRRYAEATPAPDLRLVPMPAPAPWAENEDECELMRDAGPIEDMVRRSALHALLILRDDILPVVRPLIDHDLARLDRYLRQNPDQEKVLEDQEDAVPHLVAKALATVPSGTSGDRGQIEQDRRCRLAAAFDIYLGAARHGPGASGRAAPLPIPPGMAGEWEDDLTEALADGPGSLDANTDAATIRRQVLPQLATLNSALGEVFRPLRRTRLRPAYPTGPRVDMRRLTRFEADGRDHRIWTRREKPVARDSAVQLLVDLSGSMRGEGKIAAAVGGAMLLAEALSHWKVPNVIVGFQDVLIPFKGLREPLTAAVQRRIAEMPLEVCGQRPGGNNEPGYNDDGPCLVEAAERLLRDAPEAQKLLLVISDGRPEGRRSRASDLHAAVRQLSQHRPGLEIIGLGLGPRTGHVKEFYPVSIADVPVDRIGAEIGKLLVAHCGGAARR